MITPSRLLTFSALLGFLTLVLILVGALVLHVRLEAASEAQRDVRAAVVQLQGSIQALDVQMTARTARLDESTAQIKRLTETVKEMTAVISAPAGE